MICFIENVALFENVVFQEPHSYFYITCDIVGPDIDIDIDQLNINMWFLFRYLITHRDVTIRFVCNRYFRTSGFNLDNLYVFCNPIFRINEM